MNSEHSGCPGKKKERYPFIKYGVNLSKPVNLTANGGQWWPTVLNDLQISDGQTKGQVFVNWLSDNDGGSDFSDRT